MPRDKKQNHDKPEPQVINAEPAEINQEKKNGDQTVDNQGHPLNKDGTVALTSPAQLANVPDYTPPGLHPVTDEGVLQREYNKQDKGDITNPVPTGANFGRPLAEPEQAKSLVAEKPKTYQDKIRDAINSIGGVITEEGSVFKVALPGGGGFEINASEYSPSAIALLANYGIKLEQ